MKRSQALFCTCFFAALATLSPPTVADEPCPEPGPFSLTATKVNSQQIDLNWTESNLANTYTVLRCIGSEGLDDCTALAELSAGQLIYSDTTVDCDACNTYHIFAKRSCGIFNLSFKVSNPASVPPVGATHRPSDFDGDGKSDVAVFRPSDGRWYWILSSTGGSAEVPFGRADDEPVPGDYDGDGKTDPAIFRPKTREWWIRQSCGGNSVTIVWGNKSDERVPADYDGDGKTDVAIFRPSDGTWWVRRSTDQGTTIQQWGSNGDIPAPADYDGDRKADFAIFRPSTGDWWILFSNGSHRVDHWGTNGDQPLAADYDGDGKADLAIFRPSTATWWTTTLTGATSSVTWEQVDDVPAPADYDGDGKTDIAIFRNGLWRILRSLDGVVVESVFGAAGDKAVPRYYFNPKP